MLSLQLVSKAKAHGTRVGMSLAPGPMSAATMATHASTEPTTRGVANQTGISQLLVVSASHCLLILHVLQIENLSMVLQPSYPHVLLIKS
jgi:hypothetical protein